MRERLQRWAPPALAVAPYLALCLSRIGYVPLWDGREYADCIDAAVSGGRFPVDYNCAGHPTAAYVSLISLLQWVWPGRYWPMLVMNMALGVVGLLAFRDLLRSVFPAAEREALLLTACLGALPVFVACTLNVNPDFGLAVFFLFLVRALLRGRLREAALAGLALAFTKDTGVLLYVLAVAPWVLVFVTRPAGELREKLRTLSRAWPLALPIFAFGAFLLIRSHSGHAAFWQPASGPVSLIDVFTRFRLFDPNFATELVELFVLQFVWVLSLAAFMRWVSVAIRAAFALGPAWRRELIYCDGLLILGVLLLTRYPTFTNPRYLLALAPLVLVSGLAGLRHLVARPMARLSVLAAVLALFFASALRTIDPVSKAIMGTFAFGTHRLLDMTSLTNECCGRGRDQLVYNLEHTWLDDLQDLAYEDLRPGPGRALAAAQLALLNTVQELDPRTFHRTLSRTDTLLPPLWTAADLRRAAPRPALLFFVRFPYVNNAPEEARLRAWYDPVAEHSYELAGYRLDVAEYRLR